MKNRIASIALTVVMILGCMIKGIDFNVNTVCADPYNIEIRVETKEISIEEIPEDRMVAVEVYTSNIPDEDFYIFDVAYKLDNKIEKWFDLSWGENSISSLSVQTRIENKFLFLESDTIIHSNKKIENGRIYNISIFIPRDANEGDFYEITPVSDCNNGLDFTSFALESNRENIYGPSNFYFVGGGIKIRSSQTEQPISNVPVPTSDNNNLISQSEISNNQSQISNETKEETDPIASSETSFVSVSSALSTKSTTTKTSITSEKQTDFTTNIDINTELLITSETIEEKNNNTYNIKLILVLIIFILIIITLTIIIRKRKKK